MATLISEYSSDGKKRRRCDARCYGAKGQKCSCICGGANHGVGLQKALDNTRKMVEALVQQEGVEIAPEVLEGLTEPKKVSA